MTLNLILATLSLSAPQPAPAATPDIEALLPTLAGEWTGTLAYRDYQSDDWQSIPMRESTEVFDAHTLLSRVTYQEPTWEMRELSVHQLTDDAKSLVSTSFSPRRNMTSSRALTDLEVAEDGSWSAVMVSEEDDDNRRAEVRIRVEVTANEIVKAKTVRYLDDPKAKEFWRNEVRLQRVVPELDVEELLGTWTVDLRPTPDAEAYTTELVIAHDEHGLQATFYGTEGTHVTVNDDWQEVRVALVTEDGTGVYHTSFVLVGETLVGTTHSLGREFLSRWTATRVE